MGEGERGRRGGRSRAHRNRQHHHHHHAHHHGGGQVFWNNGAMGSPTGFTTAGPCGNPCCCCLCIFAMVFFFVCIFLGVLLGFLGSWGTNDLGLAGILCITFGVIATSGTCIYLCVKARTNNDTPGAEAVTMVTAVPPTTTYYAAGEPQVMATPGAGVGYTTERLGASGQPLLPPGASFGTTTQPVAPSGFGSYPTTQPGQAHCTMPPYLGQAQGMASRTPYPPANYPENHPPVGYATPSAPAHGMASGQEAFATPYPPATFPEHPPPSSQVAPSAPTVVGNASSSVDIEAGNLPPPSYNEVTGGEFPKASCQ